MRALYCETEGVVAIYKENKVDPCFLNQCGTLMPSGVEVKLVHKLKYIICNLN